MTERGESVTKLLISVAVALLVAGPASAQFKMADLGTLPGDADSAARHINNRGEVFGTSGKHAFLWTADTGMIDLGTLDEISSSNQPTAINDRGQVVGVSVNALSQARGFLWTADTGMIDLGTLGGLTSSANALRPINNRGEVTGFSTTASSAHAFIWTDQNGMIDLGALGADGSSHAGGINELGQVVGASSFRIDGSPITHATLWTR